MRTRTEHEELKRMSHYRFDLSSTSKKNHRTRVSNDFGSASYHFVLSCSVCMICRCRSIPISRCCLNQKEKWEDKTSWVTTKRDEETVMTSSRSSWDYSSWVTGLVDVSDVSWECKKNFLLVSPRLSFVSVVFRVTRDLFCFPVSFLANY